MLITFSGKDQCCSC